MPTLKAAPLKTPSGKIELYSEVVAGFGYADCPGHATWNVPDEWAGDADAEFPLHLLGKQPANKLHSQLDPGTWSKAAKVKGREAVEVCVCSSALSCLCSFCPRTPGASWDRWLRALVDHEPGTKLRHGIAVTLQAAGRVGKI